MTFPWKNMVFEGGGVKGVAHLTAVKYFMDQGAFQEIRRVGGTSAGAIQAVPLALNYPIDDIIAELKIMNFENFKDGSFLGNVKRIINEYGFFKGDFFKDWISKIIEKTTGKPDTTFRELQLMKKERGFLDLYLVGTNVSRGSSEIFSHETTPDMPIAEATRISMSIPFFFRSVKYQGDHYCDGGLLRNYPIRIFDEKKYVIDSQNSEDGPAVYQKSNVKYGKSYVQNNETLGFRVDSTEEIEVYKGIKPRFKTNTIEDIFEYTLKIISILTEAQDNTHLESNDWRRTVYINSRGIGTFDFDLSPEEFKKLTDSGKEFGKKYLDWWKAARPA